MTDPNGTNRREFLKVAGAAAAAGLASVPMAHAAGSETIKVGLIGCGGRGRGALDNLCEAAGDTYSIKVHAIGDLFKDHLDNAVSSFKKEERTASRMDVSDDRLFTGFDAYQKVIDSGVDLVILATPPGFRPMMLEAAVKAGKNIFTEKPVAVDGTGIRKVLAAAEEAKSKNLAIVAGTQRRHQAGYIESIGRIHDGAIGDVVGGQVYWNQGGLWKIDRTSSMSDTEWQIRNWLYFVWLSGDHIVEQHVHNLDVANWALGAHPERCVGLGGRQVRTDPVYGHIFDHFAVDYEYPNGVHLMSMARQIDGTDGNISETIVGSKGNFYSNGYRFSGDAKKYRFRAKEVNPYVQEHIDLLASIKAGKPLNELKQVAESTLTAIMGRMSTYTGKAVTWDQALNSQLDTFPKTLEFGPMPVPPVAMPGVTELI